MSQRTNHSVSPLMITSRRALARYVNGKALTTGWIHAGAFSMGKKMPDRNIMGVPITCASAAGGRR